MVGNLPLNPDQKVLDPATKELIDRLLLEGLSKAGIAPALKVSEQWLQDYVNRKYAQIPRTVQVSLKKGRCWIREWYEQKYVRGVENDFRDFDGEWEHLQIWDNELVI